MSTSSPCHKCKHEETDAITGKKVKVSGTCQPISGKMAKGDAPDIMVVTDRGLTYDQLTRLIQRLESAGVSEHRVAIIPLIKCGMKPDGALKLCRWFAQREIAAAQPKAVITVGPLASQVFNKEKRHKSIVGSVIARVIELPDYPKWSGYSTHALSSEELDMFPADKEDDAWALSRALDIADGKYPRQPWKHEGNSYTLVETVEQWEQWLQSQDEANRLLAGFDIETGGMVHQDLDEFDVFNELDQELLGLTKDDLDWDLLEAVGLDCWNDASYICGYSMALNAGNAVYAHTKDNPDLEQAVLNTARRKWLILQNGKFDLTFIKIKTGVDLRENQWWDTMLASHQLRDWSRNHGLKFLVSRYLPDFDGYEDDLEAFFGDLPKSKRDYGLVPKEIMCTYAAIDADACLRIGFQQMLEMQKVYKGGVEFHRTHLLNTQYAYSECEINGWGWDPKTWEKLHEMALKNYAKADAAIRGSKYWKSYKGTIEERFHDDNIYYYDEESQCVYYDKTCSELVQEPGGPVVLDAALDFNHRHKFVRKDGTRVNSRTYTLEDLEPKLTNANTKRELFFSPKFMGLKPSRFTEKTKQPQVTKYALLDQLRESKLPENKREVLEAFQDLEKTSKQLSTYLKPVEKHVRADGMIHPRYMLAGHDTGHGFSAGGTRTGRVSSAGPNMTNQPSRKDGKIFKSQFIARPRDCHGRLVEDSEQWMVGQLDYSQLELRVLADLSSEQMMVDAYLAGEDLHRKLACQLFNKDVEWFIERLSDEDHPENKIASDMRTVAKTSWFAMVYGSGPATLEDILKIMDARKEDGKFYTLDDCEAIIKDMENKLPAVMALKKQVQNILDSQQYPHLYTRMGRRGLIPNVMSNENWVRYKGYRQGFNFLIQSEGSDVCSAALYRVVKWLQSQRANGIRSYVMGTVHDSVILAMPASEVDYVLYNVQQIMSDTSVLPWKPKIDFNVDAEVGPNWAELKTWSWKPEPTGDKIAA